MKVAPIVEAMKRREREFTPLVVHTGQHYDALMSDVFFRDLELAVPDIHLGVGSASHAAQTAAVMARFEPVVVQEKPDWILVVGDVNSTLACALTGSKLGVKVAHVEAGLRSRDRSMPEEINRLLTDQLSDLLLTPSEDGDRNLSGEGIPAERVRLVGNVMIDSLLKHLELAAASDARERFGVAGADYAVVTLHRPSNVDDPATLRRILRALARVSRLLPVVFPIHPRTRKNLADFGLDKEEALSGGLRLTEPLGYLDFLRLYSGARLVLTDSGGIQEETTALGIPCLTLRESTERPVTVEMGTNVIVGTDATKIISEATVALNGSAKRVARQPPLWDGHTSERILNALEEFRS